MRTSAIVVRPGYRKSTFGETVSVDFSHSSCIVISHAGASVSDIAIAMTILLITDRCFQRLDRVARKLSIHRIEHGRLKSRRVSAPNLAIA